MLRNSLLGTCPAVTQPSPTAGTARCTVRLGSRPPGHHRPPRHRYLAAFDMTAPHDRHLTLNGAGEAWPWSPLGRRKSSE